MLPPRRVATSFENSWGCNRQRFESVSIRHVGSSSSRGAARALKAMGSALALWVSTTRRSANLESEAARVPHAAGNRWVSERAWLSSSPLSANFGQPAGRCAVSKTALATFDSLAARQFYSGVGCWHPSSAAERSPRRSDSCRLIQYTSRGLSASPLGFEPKARRFDSCLVFHLIACSIHARGEEFVRNFSSAADRSDPLGISHGCSRSTP